MNQRKQWSRNHASEQFVADQFNADPSLGQGRPLGGSGQRIRFGNGCLDRSAGRQQPFSIANRISIELRRSVVSIARRLHAWLKRWRVAEAALCAFETMSERELLDIGITRADAHRAAWGASARDDDCLPNCK
jgi:uncharacterized protein YjiS (DUF1127 family)